MFLNCEKMYLKVAFLMFFINCALSRHAPHYSDLDEDEQVLFRAAYDTPSYDHVEVADQDFAAGKLDLLKDFMWALKVKMQEIKAFNKAMAANMLSSKLQLKDLKALVQPIAHHHHKVIAEKPTYSYQAPSYSAPPAPAYEQTYSYSAPPQAHYDKPYGPQKPYSQQYSGSQEQVYEQPYAAPQQHQHDPYYGV